MIPLRATLYIEPSTCPHTRGDDPVDAVYSERKNALVPTRVGMILELALFENRKRACPHTRGDDPGCGYRR